MPITVAGFKDFARWPTNGSKASGLLVLTRKNPASQNIINIQRGETFTTSFGQVFVSLEKREINESQQMIEILAQASEVGGRYSIPANSHWQNTEDYSISNPKAFVGGYDARSVTRVSSHFYKEFSDLDIQSNLNVAQSLVKDEMGYTQDENLPEAERIEQAVYSLTILLVENREIQERKDTLDLGDQLKSEITSYYRARIEPAVYRKVRILINPWRRVSAFMPGGESATA